MKEVFSKSFWEGVKKTFDEAREGPPPGDEALRITAEVDRRETSTAESPATSSDDPAPIEPAGEGQEAETVRKS
jgi:hypothetical protein